MLLEKFDHFRVFERIWCVSKGETRALFIGKGRGIIGAFSKEYS